MINYTYNPKTKEVVVIGIMDIKSWVLMYNLMSFVYRRTNVADDELFPTFREMMRINHLGNNLNKDHNVFALSALAYTTETVRHLAAATTSCYGLSGPDRAPHDREVSKFMKKLSDQIDELIKKDEGGS